jgi:CubicO group peptidase (beta-lactamase class C family)
MRLRQCRTAIVLLLWSAVVSPAVAQPLPPGEPEALGMSSERLNRIDRVMQMLIDSSRTAGIATLIVRDGHIVHSGVWGWADREARRALTGDALFRIASQTKAVTTVAVMMLLEEGRVRLADNAHLWVPALAHATVMTDSGPVPVRRPITIRDLLTHTAGISYGVDASVRDRYGAAGLGPAAGWGWYMADKPEPICTLMDRLATLPFVAQPGERFVYGYNTDLLGCIVERVSGMPLDEFFRARIFEPLAMHDTYFFVSPAQRHRLTTVYAANEGRLERAPDDALGQGAYVDGPRASFSGGAGLVSTIGDYARFLQMLANGGELNGVRLLAPSTVELMTRDHIGALFGRPGFGMSLGFDYLDDPGVAGRHGNRGAWGWGGAYATTYWVDPAERLVALIMTQTLPSGGLDAADRFRALVYAAIVGPPDATKR